MAIAGTETGGAPALPGLRLVVSSGAPLSVGTVRRLREATPAVVANGYGMTETPQLVACRVISGDPAIDDPSVPSLASPVSHWIWL